MTSTTLGMRWADEWTDEQLASFEGVLRAEYKSAEADMRKKLEEALRGYQKELEARLRALDNTEQARAAHEAWLRGKALEQQRMGGIIDYLAKAAVESNERSIAALSNYIPGVYAENANRAAFAIETAVRSNDIFDLVDEDTVRELVRAQDGGSAIIREVPNPVHDRPKDYRWNRQKFTSAITQGILQGESIPHIVKRTESIFGSNLAAATRAARTATTGAENAGRLSSYRRAKSMGIDMKQEWMATTDARTRPTHRQLDGEAVEVGSSFSNGCQFPGDPGGPPHEVYNCRCTLVAKLEGIDGIDIDSWSKTHAGEEYETWKDVKRQLAAASQAPKQKQVDIAALTAQAAQYDDEVKRYASQVKLHDASGGQERYRKQLQEYADRHAQTMKENEWARGFDRDELMAESNRLYEEQGRIYDEYSRLERSDPRRDELWAEYNRYFELTDDIDKRIDALRAYERAEAEYNRLSEEIENVAKRQERKAAERSEAERLMNEARANRNRIYGEISEAQRFAPQVRQTLGDAYADAMEALVDSAAGRHPEIANVYRHYSSQLKVSDGNLRRGAHYDPRDRGIHFNAQAVADGSYFKMPYSTAFHEFGHLIDDYSGFGPLGDTSMYNNLTEVIKKDWTRFRNAEAKKLGVTRDKNQAVIDMLLDEGARTDKMTYAAVSDQIEGCTGVSYPLGIGHGSTYHRRNKGYTGLEFVAELFESAMTNEASYQQMQRIFPNAVKMVEEMAKEMCA